MPSSYQSSKKPFRRPKKTKYKKTTRSLPRAKQVSETKLVKQILLAANNPTFTTAMIFNTPYFSDVPALEGSFNFAITNNGATLTDHYLKDFIRNGTGMNERIGRQCTILNARSKLILEIKHISGDDPSPLQFRVIQGWIKQGIDQFMDLTTEVTTMYSEMNWNKYKVLKDYIVNRRPLSTGPVAAASASYKPIIINSVWSPNRVLKWDKDTTGSTAVPAQYQGYAPFLMIFNLQYATFHLETQFYKRTIAFKDL